MTEAKQVELTIEGITRDGDGVGRYQEMCIRDRASIATKY